MATRLETLTRTRYERGQELAKLRLRLEELPAERQAERAKAIRLAPTQSTFSRGTAVAKLNAEEDLLRSRIPNLEGELAALDVEIQAAAVEQAQIDLIEPVEYAESLGEREREAWAAIGELVAQAIDHANTIFAIATERDQLLLANEATIQECPDGELKARAEAAFRCPVSPMPMDFTELSHVVNEAVLDPANQGYREEGGSRSIPRAVLDLLPDLRSENRQAALSGRHEQYWGVRNNAAPVAILPAR